MRIHTSSAAQIKQTFKHTPESKTHIHPAEPLQKSAHSRGEIDLHSVAFVCLSVHYYTGNNFKENCASRLYMRGNVSIKTKFCIILDC